ncbi:MAG: FtsX-like permease family protein [Gammaproteobacteria bacterium]|nr:FtsX-like permease family protein [Gammaproteobacteria bacterium]
MSLLVLGESVLLCLVGGVLGVLLGAAVSYALKPSIEQILGLFEVSWSTAFVAVGLAAVLGLVVGAVPAAAARRLAIVDALRAR